MQKRGQATLFIILGIALLIIIGAFLFFTQEFQKAPLDKAARIAEEIPLEFNPIKVFTEDCLKVTAEQGIRRLGQSGGYIYPEQWHGIFFDEQDPTASDGLQFPGSDLQIPFWHYNTKPNDDSLIIFSSLKPTIPQMELDLERWVEQELPACLDNYNLFEERGFDIVQSSSETLVTIVPGAVQIAVSKPLTLKNNDAQAAMRHFFVSIPADILHLYETASQITLAEQNFSFLEQNTLSLISLFSAPDKSKLPPMTASTFDFANAVFWEEENVKEDLKLMLATYTPLLRYYDSGNYYSYTYPQDTKYFESKQKVYENMVLPLTGGGDLEIRFNYLDTWQPYLDTNSQGGTIEPQSASISLLNINFGMQRYKTTYDLSYPVLVSLHDPSAFNNQGLFFNIALETNIRNNRPVKTEQILPPTFSQFEPSLFCNRNHRTSGDITIVARDAFTLKPIQGAAVSYVLGDETCTIGSTDEKGILTAKFPIALGGLVHVSHGDFAPIFTELDTASNQDFTISTDLWKYKTIEVDIQKKQLLKASPQGPLPQPTVSGWTFQGTPRTLADDDQASVTLTRVDSRADQFVTGTATVGNQVQTMRILPGTYEFTAQGTSGKNIRIPPDRRVSGTTEYFVPPQPGFNFEQFPGILMKWESPQTLEILPGELYNSDHMTIYVLELGLAEIPEFNRKIEDLEMLEKMAELSIQFKPQLLPQYS